MINKDNFLIKFNKSNKKFKKYVIPFIDSIYPLWSWNGEDAYYGFIDGQGICTSDYKELTKNSKIIISSVDEFRKIFLGENTDPSYEIY